MNKALVVMGASSDMGAALIERCGANYDCIVAHYRTMNEKLHSVLARLPEKEIVLLQIDFKESSDKPDAVASELGDVAKKLEGYAIHLVHFPAAQCQNNRFHKIPWDVFQDDIDISFRSFVIASQALLPVMIKAKTGKIVVMLSYLCENIPAKYCANYIALKYALLGLMKALAAEYGDKGITVNAVSPATVETKYISNQSDILINEWLKKSPLKRNLHVDEVVPSIEFLLSDGASCINGENVVVSCGMAAH